MTADELERLLDGTLHELLFEMDGMTDEDICRSASSPRATSGGSVRPLIGDELPAARSTT